MAAPTRFGRYRTEADEANRFNRDHLCGNQP
jgi:hypothetical protein